MHKNLQKAMEYADKYIEQNDLPKHTQIESMAQFGETAMFKQFFSDWRDIDATDGLGETHTVGSIAKVEHEDFDASTMHDNPQTAAEFGMPDDGSGDKKIYKIVDSEREEVDEENYGIFNSSDCYIISYTYETPKGKPESYIYYWLGNNAGTAAETAAAFQVVQVRFQIYYKKSLKCTFSWMVKNSTEMQLRFVLKKEKNQII